MKQNSVGRPGQPRTMAGIEWRENQDDACEQTSRCDDPAGRTRGIRGRMAESSQSRTGTAASRAGSHRDTFPIRRRRTGFARSRRARRHCHFSWPRGGRRSDARPPQWRHRSTDQTPEALWRERLGTRLAAQMAIRPAHSPRFIGVADGHREILRVDRSGPNGAVRIVPENSCDRSAMRPISGIRSVWRRTELTSRMSV